MALFGSAMVGAHAEDANRITVLEENDSLYFNSDKHYTQGLRVSNLGPAVRSDSGWSLRIPTPRACWTVCWHGNGYGGATI